MRVAGPSYACFGATPGLAGRYVLIHHSTFSGSLAA